MDKCYKRGVLIAFCLLLGPVSWCQNVTETNWFFGNSSEYLVFDRNGRDAVLETNQATPFGQEGSAVVTDQLKGNVLFYSDGQNVYDGSHRLVPAVAGGTILSGNLSFNQPVVACPFPDNTDQYYFFTNNGSEIQYSIADASLMGNATIPEFPLGDITSFNQPTGISDPSEGMAILPGAGGQQFWLITQNQTNFAFQVTPIDNIGIGATVLYNVFPASLPGFEAVQFAPLGDSLIAVAPKGTNRNVMIMNFDSSTGDLTFNRTLQNSGFPDTTNTVNYDVEWSNDGTKLYISRTGDGTNPGNIYQVDFADTVNTPLPVTPVLDYDLYKSYGLQKAIDGRIYHLYQLNDANSPYILGRINEPDSTVAADVEYDSLVFDDDFNGRQFPQFAPGYLPPDFFTVSFDYFDSCANSSTKFVARVDPLPNNYFWDFGDGNSALGPAPINTYMSTGNFPVTLTVESNGIRQSYTEFVPILPTDSADLGNDTTICVDEVLMLDPGVQGISYLWSTGEATPTISVDTAGTYWVEVTTVTGCTTFDDIIVTEYGVVSQKFNKWYFGERAGLDFTFGSPIPIDDGNQMSSAEGCATISDVNGNLLFYTNGSTVWNKDHQVMVNGTDIGGDETAVQSALIMPFDGDNTLFYIFTTEEVYGDFTFNMKISIVDMKADSARGKVAIKGVPIIECSTERLTATGFGGGAMLLAHEYGNNDFRGYQIGINGLSQAIFSTAGEIHAFDNEPNATGYMKFSPNLDQVAVLIPDNPNYIDILDFDPGTGVLSNSQIIDVQEPGSAVYGLEFSTSGDNLFVTTTGGVSKLLKYELDSLNTSNGLAEVLASKLEIATGSNYGALQTGPDGLIYMAVDGSNFVGRISNPDGTTVAEVGFTEQAIDVDQDGAGRLSRLGMPNFTQTVAMSPTPPFISTTTACAGLETQFSGAGRDSSIEMFVWDFGDGFVTGELSSPDTSHVYAEPGSYNISLTLSNRCDVDTVLYDTIQVYSIPESPMVPTDTVLCGGEVTLAAWDVDDPSLNYYWSTGDSTRTVTFTEPTIVDVAIINSDSCSSDTVTVFIAENETYIDLGNDRLMCQYDSLILDANIGGTQNFTWYRDGIEVGDQRTQLVNSATAGMFTYSVEFINRFTGCIFTDTVEVEIQPTPGAFQVNPVLPSCGASNGSFQLEITDSGNYSYDLQGPVTDGPYTIDGPAITPAFANLSAGTYTSTITNTVTGCSNIEVLLLENDAPFDIEASPLNDCANTSDITLQILNDLPSAINIDVTNSFGVNVYSATEPLTTRNVVIEDLDSGTYYIQVEDVDPPNCIQTDTVTLSVTDLCFRKIFVPNAFSPGSGTSLNEEWFAFPNQFVENFEIYIYNRWGDLVFYSDTKDFRWDGTYNGKPVTQGTYAYRMRFTSSLEPEAGTLEQYGSVTVVK